MFLWYITVDIVSRRVMYHSILEQVQVIIDKTIKSCNIFDYLFRAYRCYVLFFTKFYIDVYGYGYVSYFMFIGFMIMESALLSIQKGKCPLSI